MLVCVFSHSFAHETAGAARTRQSLLPLMSRVRSTKLGRIAPREGEAMSGNANGTATHSLSSPAHAGDPVRRGFTAQALTSLEYWIARSSRAMTAGERGESNR